MNRTGIGTVLHALDYAGSEGLVTPDTGPTGAEREFIWQEVQQKFGIDAAYFHADVPVIFFKVLDPVDDQELAAIHRQLWNYNRAPLLIVVSSGEVRVYNCFAPPTRDSARGLQAALLEKTALVADILELRQQLSSYGRLEVESGRVNRERLGHYDRRQRADRWLLDNLSVLRRVLIGSNLREEVVNSLIGRSIYVRYLEGRHVLTAESLRELVGSRSYFDVLQSSRSQTYRLFAHLAERFNGDVFPVTVEEEATVRAEHLHTLASFLRGDELASGQMYFWAYDFNSIPIELISSIYEEFLHSEQEETGAYYTPPEVVDFVLDEVLPWDGTETALRILDPACGSGVFLVQAYRRLVCRAQRAAGTKELPFPVLRDLLTEHIYGVDLKGDSIKVAAFSCYLALLDFVEPKRIRTEVRFPALKGSNLFQSDFFDLEAPFNVRRYDIVAGNPPWQSNLSEPARAYIRQRHLPVGDKQSAQAFLWRAPDVVAEGGKVCLLAPSKGLLFNQSSTNSAFRKEFLSSHNVWAIVNFSAFRHTLFRNATSPMSAVFYRVSPEGGDDRLLYCTPHPSPLAERLSGVVLANDEIRSFSRSKALRNPDIWKVAYWGTPRDFTLIEDLRRRFPPLEDVAEERKWIIHEGLQVGGADKRSAPADLLEMPYVLTEAVSPFHIDLDVSSRLSSKVFHRLADPRIYRAPHLLIRRGVLTGGFLAAAYAQFDAVFKHSVIGIAATAEDAEQLKILCALLNSSLARYYHFLTGSAWGIERDEVQKNDHLTLPCPIPIRDRRLNDELLALVGRIERSPSMGWRADLDELVHAAYGLTSSERHLIADTLNVTLPRFCQGTQSSAFDEVSPDELRFYAQAYVGVLNSTIGPSERLFRALVYEGSAPYQAVSFYLTKREHDAPLVESATAALEEVLKRLNRLALEQRSEGMYVRRDIKIYEKDTVHAVKPRERRYWTRSAAYNDADETISRLLQVWMRANA